MIATWMLYAVAVSVLVGLAAYFFERGARFARLPGRWAWLAAMLSSALIPLYSLYSLYSLIRPATAMGGSVVPGSAPAAPAGFVIPELPHLTVLDQFSGLLIAAWTGAALLLCGATVWTLLRLWEETSRLPLDEIDGTEVRRSTVFGPAVVGIIKNQVVIPDWIGSVAPGAEHLATVHERSHLVARDSLVQFLGLALAVLFPWNPVLWWQFRRLRVSVELDCDARVVRSGTDVKMYADLLLQIAANRVRSPFPAVALLSTKSQLGRRVITMAEQIRPPRFIRTSLAVALGTVLAVAACETPQPLAVDNAAVESAFATPGEIGATRFEAREIVETLPFGTFTFSGEEHELVDSSFEELPDGGLVEWIDEGSAGHLRQIDRSRFDPAEFEVAPLREILEGVHLEGSDLKADGVEHRFGPEGGTLHRVPRQSATEARARARFTPASPVN